MKRLTVAALSALASTAASAQWTDGFESYPLGPLHITVNGWHGWDDASAAAGVISAAAGPHRDQEHGDRSGRRRRLRVDRHQLRRWTLSQYLYVPTGFLGTSYYILLNTYEDLQRRLATGRCSSTGTTSPA